MMEQIEQLRHAGLFEARVPQYTSFPPVNRFVSGEGALHQKRWLNDLPRGADVSLYVHLPYCEKECWFCAYRTQATDDTARIDAYVAAVLEEIALVRREMPQEVSLSRLHLGGGTPTMLTPPTMQALFDGIDAAFPRAPGFECAVEVAADRLDPGLAELLVRVGMTRAILGIQDFDQAVQKVIGRTLRFEDLFETVQTLRRAGVRTIDMDMLFGLPAQTAAGIGATTQKVLALEPDRVAVCEYAHVPWLAKRQILVDTRRLTAAEDAFAMFCTARDLLRADGFETLGVDHFVRAGDPWLAARSEGRLRRDFFGYSDDRAVALIGLGASAVSRFPQGFVQNQTATSLYEERVQAGRLPGDRGHRLTETERLTGCMIDMLFSRFEIDTRELAARFPGSGRFLAKAIADIGAGFRDCVEVLPGRLALRAEAQPLVRLISHALDRFATLQSDAYP